MGQQVVNLVNILSDLLATSEAEFLWTGFNNMVVVPKLPLFLDFLVFGTDNWFGDSASNL